MMSVEIQTVVGNDSRVVSALFYVRGLSISACLKLTDGVSIDRWRSRTLNFDMLETGRAF